MNRNLDGYYFRVKRNDKFENICWSDLTEEEMKECLQSFDRDALLRFCIGLGQCLHNIGDELNLYGGVDL